MTSGCPGRLCLVFLLAGCSSVWLKPHPPEPISEDSGALILRVSLEEGWFQNRRAHAVGVARLKSDGGVEDKERVSSFRAGDNLYILDVRAGRYVPRWASFRDRGRESRISFDRILTSTFPVSVGPSQVSFMGSYRFVRRRDGGRETIKLRLLDQKISERRRALDAAQKDLARTLWADGVAKARGGLGASELTAKPRVGDPPARRAGPDFSYVDLLGWGEPSKIAGGIEWRQPKGRARIALLLLKQGMNGFRPPEQYLRQLRDLGSPEDTHRVVEINLPSRAAYSVRYTSYVYPPDNLIGVSQDVYVTESVVAPDKRGLYLLHYRARQEYFNSYYGLFKLFRDQVIFGESTETIP